MIMKKIKYIILFLLLSLCREAVFYDAYAATITDQDSVVIDALVPAESEESPPPGGGGPIIPETVPPVISKIVISDITLSSAKISWITDELAIPQVNYGKTADLEKTYIGGSFTTENSIIIEDLQPETKYYFEIIAIDRAGNRSSAENLNFFTLGIKDIVPPANVSGLKAKAGDSKIELMWQNPADIDFENVIIARSGTFYPKNAGEGVVVYSGGGESFTDTDLLNGTRYYYSVFASDSGGNISSGAVVSATPEKPPKKPEIPPEKPGMPPEETPPEKPEIPPEKPIEPEVPPEEIPPEIKEITIDDFIFLQNDEKISLKEGKLEIDPEKEISLSIEAGKIPEEVGSIMIILTRENEEYSYLMKKDENRGVYSASIKLADKGEFDVTIVFLNRDNKIMKAVSGSMYPVVTTRHPESRFSAVDYIFPLIIFLVILILYKVIKKILKDRRSKNKKTTAQ